MCSRNRIAILDERIARNAPNKVLKMVLIGNLPKCFAGGVVLVILSKFLTSSGSRIRFMKFFRLVFSVKHVF